MTYSKVQLRAIEEIKKVTEHFGKSRWFTQPEITGIGYHTLMALVNKKYLEDQYFDGFSYYRLKE